MSESPDYVPLEVRPCTIKRAKPFIKEHHRHNPNLTGALFATSVHRSDTGECVGVGVAGRPVARMADDGRTIEITRCCTTGAKNAASMVYGSLTRAAKALGYSRAITYTLSSEDGTSLRASNWVQDGLSDCTRQAKGWNSRDGRAPRKGTPLDVVKTRWSLDLRPSD